MIQQLQGRLNNYTANGGYEGVLSLATVKNHVIVQHDHDDEMLKIYRDASVEHVEDITRRTVNLSEYKVFIDQLCRAQSFRLPPIREINSVTYEAADGSRYVAPEDSVTLRTDGEYGELCPTSSWPIGAKNIQATVIAGYGQHTIASSATETNAAYPMAYGAAYGVAAGEVLALPVSITQAMLLLIGHWYANREAVVVGTISADVPHAVDSLLFKYRNYRI